jgi:hypothetical protein
LREYELGQASSTCRARIAALEQARENAQTPLV